MNDEFLTKFHKTPRAAFADVLYERISQQPQPRFPGTIATKLTFRNAAVAFLFVLLVAACVYAVVEKRWNKVGGIWVNVQRTLEVDFSPPVDFTPPSEVTEEPEIQPTGVKCLSAEEARKILRFELNVPTWVPDGFTFDDKVCGWDLDRLSDYASLYWEGADKYSGIQITVSNLRWFNMATQKYEVGPPSVWMPVGPGSYEEVQVHGQPAVLIRGDWEEPWETEEMQSRKYEFKWDKKRALQLYWVDEEEVFYRLYTRAKVSPEDLIKMAESAR